MDKIGYIEINIKGTKGNLDLTPENYDIREIIDMLEKAENLLYPVDKRERPTISYKIETGSVRHILKTSIQYIIGFNALLLQVNQSQNIDFLELTTAKAIEGFQNTATKKNYSISITTSLENTNELKIDRTTTFYRTEALWVDADLYFYGKITNAGGKDKTNIHVLTDDFGTIIIQTPVSFFEKLEENIIHKKQYGIHVNGKQNSETGEIDTSSLRFVNILDFEPRYDDSYLKKLRDKAKSSWLANIDTDKWLKDIRQGYEA